jgi:hypothetical protein
MKKFIGVVAACAGTWLLANGGGGVARADTPTPADADRVCAVQGLISKQMWNQPNGTAIVDCCSQPLFLNQCNRVMIFSDGRPPQWQP